MSSVRHHFVPQGFLRGFAAEEEATRSFVWVYDKQQDRTPRKKAIRSIAWAPAYYAQEREDGSTDFDTLETSLATTIDNKIPLVLNSLRPRVGRTIELSGDDKGALAFFVGLSLTRVPSFRDGMNDFHSKVAQIALSHEAAKDDELAKAIERYGIKAEAKPWVSLRPMVSLAQAVASSALTKHWQFFLAPPEVPFVTSDNPVVFTSAGEKFAQIGPAHPEAELMMNIRKDLSLVCTPRAGYSSMRVFSLSPAEARKFNRGIVRAARQRIFASQFSDEFDRFVKKYAGNEQRIVV